MKAKLTDTACMAMTSMLLAKLVDSGVIEHWRMRDEFERQGRHDTYRDFFGRIFVFSGSRTHPDPEWHKLTLREQSQREQSQREQSQRAREQRLREQRLRRELFADELALSISLVE